MSTVARITPGSRSDPVGSHPVGRRMRRIGLGFFFASIAVNAALGIFAVLAPDFGETQGKVLATSLCVSGAVLLALACEPAWERRLLGAIPIVGAGLGAIGFAFVIGTIWWEPERVTYGRIEGTILVYAVACAVASLLALATLAPVHSWLFRVTLGLLAVGATMSAVLPWLGDDPAEWFLRAFGVVMIVLAAFAVTVPVLHWIDRGALAAAEAGLGGAVRFCPYCGAKVTGPVRDDVEIACERCGRGFEVRSADELHANLT